MPSWARNPDAADNRWLREASENQVPVIYFLGIAPGRYHAIFPAFIAGWDATTLTARITFGLPDHDALDHDQNLPVPVVAVVRKAVPVYLDYVGTAEAIRSVTLQAKVGGYL
jgi:hypothetical protein